MRLKVACWFFAVLTAFMLLGWPSVVGAPPRHAPKAILKRYAVRVEVGLAVIVSSFLLTTIFAALVVRQTRREYVEESAKNLRDLVEGTLEDHRKKSGSQSDPS